MPSTYTRTQRPQRSERFLVCAAALSHKSLKSLEYGTRKQCYTMAMRINTMAIYRPFLNIIYMCWPQRWVCGACEVCSFRFRQETIRNTVAQQFTTYPGGGRRGEGWGQKGRGTTITSVKLHLHRCPCAPLRAIAPFRISFRRTIDS